MATILAVLNTTEHRGATLRDDGHVYLTSGARVPFYEYTHEERQCFQWITPEGHQLWLSSVCNHGMGCTMEAIVHQGGDCFSTWYMSVHPEDGVHLHHRSKNNRALKWRYIHSRVVQGISQWLFEAGTSRADVDWQFPDFMPTTMLELREVWRDNDRGYPELLGVVMRAGEGEFILKLRGKEVQVCSSYEEMEHYCTERYGEVSIPRVI